MSYTVSRIKDRTGDFRATLEAHASYAQPQQANGSSSRLLPKKPAPSDFAKRAGSLARDIAGTSEKLGRLAQLARRKTMFDDRPVEISELTYIIKHDIANINTQLANLQAFNRAQQKGPPGSKKLDKSAEHRGNVVTLLQTSLAGTSSSFKDILEVRTQNMKASRDRSEQFAFTGAPGSQPGENSDSPLYRPRAGQASQAAMPVDDGYDPKRKEGEFLALDMGQQEQQVMMMEEQSGEYYQQRSNAVSQIESTIAELGNVFSQLAHLVSEQGEQITRIDEDTIEVGLNVDGAQRELLKTLANATSNRWLMIKIFGVLIAFFLMFIIVS